MQLLDAPRCHRQQQCTCTVPCAELARSQEQLTMTKSRPAPYSVPLNISMICARVREPGPQPALNVGGTRCRKPAATCLATCHGTPHALQQNTLAAHAHILFTSIPPPSVASRHCRYGSGHWGCGRGRTLTTTQRQRKQVTGGCSCGTPKHSCPPDHADALNLLHTTVST